MANNELLKTDDFQIIKRGKPQPLKSNEVPKGEIDILEGLFSDEQEQKNKILKSLLGLTKYSLLIIIYIVLFQSIARVWITNYRVFDGNELEILAVSVFGQIIGVIFSIASKLWDSKKFLDHIKNIKK